MTLTEKPSETSEVSTPPEMLKGTQFPGQHGSKSTPVFLPTDGQNSWFLLQNLVSLLSDTSVQPENTYFGILNE